MTPIIVHWNFKRVLCVRERMFVNSRAELSSRALEGERKQVTVRFADVKGSMGLSELLDPEQWHRVLERFFGILSEGPE